MDDGEADNAARHRAMPSGGHPSSPAGNRGLHNTRAQGMMGLAWNLRGLSPSRELPTSKVADQGQDPQFSLLGPAK